MKICPIAKLCAWSLGLMFSVTPPSLAVAASLRMAELRPLVNTEIDDIEEIIPSSGCQDNFLKEPAKAGLVCLAAPLGVRQWLGESLPTETILQELAKADVVYLGETHDRVGDHAAQMEIIQNLHDRNPKIAIAMEMFQRPYQEVLDGYLSGELSESELVEQSEYDTRWGFPWEYYAPVLRYAKENQLPVLAVNVPSEITRKVARNGLDSLTSQERQWIPPFEEIRTDNDGYRQLVREVYEEIHQGHGGSGSFERFFLAQVLWDETMAEAIASFVADNPDYQVIVLAGRGHIVYSYGIPSRVARRVPEQISDRNFLQRTLLFAPETEFPQRDSQPAADFFWYAKPE